MKSRGFQKITPKTNQLAKILSGGRSSQIVDLNIKTLRTADAKILPKGYQLRRGECVPYFVEHRRFHKWLMSLSNHLHKRISNVGEHTRKSNTKEMDRHRQSGNVSCIKV